MSEKSRTLHIASGFEMICSTLPPEVDTDLLDLVGVVVLDFFFVEFLAVDGAPGIDDVG